MIPAGLLLVCRATLRLFDAKGQELALAAWEPRQGAVTLEASGSQKVYVFDDNCAIRVAAKA